MIDDNKDAIGKVEVEVDGIGINMKKVTVNILGHTECVNTKSMLYYDDTLYYTSRNGLLM